MHFIDCCHARGVTTKTLEAMTSSRKAGSHRSNRTTIILAMKLTFIFLTAAFLQVGAKGLAQNNVTYSGKKVKLETVFKEIKKQTGYSFFYNVSDLEKATPVSIELKNTPLEEALSLLLKNQPLTFSINGKTIAIKEKQESPNVNGGNDNVTALPPPIDVKGRIVDENGKPVVANVVEKGTGKGTTTNDNGEFELKGVDDNATLVISGVSIESFEVKVNGRSELALGAKVKVTQQEEVTINTGYQKLKPNEVTGSTTYIDSRQLDQRVSTDIISKLEGITNGLVFYKDPFDGSNKLRIRGESTIFGYSNPLIVVDNFPYDGNINNINPNDVENITVLKDAAAASIWGVQAGNGVIVITTKKGKSNQPLKVQLNSSFTISSNPDLSYLPKISSSDYIDFETLLFNKGNYDALLNDPSYPLVSPIIEILNKQKLGQISASDAESQINSYRSLNVINDLKKYVYRKNQLQQLQINFSGGTNKATYFFSIGFDKNVASVIGNNSNRITLNTRNTFNPVKNLEFNIGISYTQSSSTNTGSPAIANLFPYTQLKDNVGNDLSIPQHRSGFEDTISTLHNFPSWRYYPLQERNFQTNTDKNYDTRLVTGLKYTIINSLFVDMSYQYEHSNNLGSDLRTAQSFEVRNDINHFAIISNGNFVGSNFPNGGLLDLSSNELTGQYGRASLNLNKSFGQHSLSAIGGIDVREIKTNQNSHRLFGYDQNNDSYIVPDMFAMYPTYPSGTSNLGGASAAQLSYVRTTNRFRSYFTNVVYNYRRKYAISGSARLDGSNYFGVKTNNKVVPLWSIGTKWNISDEPFYNFKLLPLLNLRATYGYNGNLAQNVAAITTFKYVNNDGYTGLPYAGVNNIPNPDLRWEKISQLNLGFDYAFKNDRVKGTLDFFWKKGNDLIGDALIDPTSGVSQIRGNFSGMTTKGMDFLIKVKTVNRNIKWNQTLIINYFADRITKYDVPPPSAEYYMSAYFSAVPVVGKPLYSLYNYKWAGLDPLTGAPRIYLADTVSNANSYQASLLKLSDLKYSGRYNPPLAGSLLNQIIWKNLELNVNITFKAFYYFQRYSLQYTRLAGPNGWQFAGNSDFSTRWQKPGDEELTNVPSLYYPLDSKRDLLYANSTALVEKGDHIRLQYINLSYNVTRESWKSLPFNGLTLYVYANNLGVLWKANNQGIDPDYPHIGILSYPPPKTFSAGIKINF